MIAASRDATHGGACFSRSTLNLLQRIFPQPVAFHEKLVKSPQRREMQTHGCTRLFHLEAFKKITAKMVARAFLPRRNSGLRPECLQRVAVVYQCARCGVPLKFHRMEKCFDQFVFFYGRHGKF